ncbi:MAG: redoxin family protein [Planctomycetes bacterium]|nr:redoxin family protein [Planctomycetota bacterium]
MSGTSRGLNRCALFLALTLFAPVGQRFLAAQDPKPEEKKQAEADPYAVPNGTPEELLKFIEKVQQRPEKLSVLESQQHAKKAIPAMIAAADKILASQADEGILLQAVTAKVAALQGLAALGDATADAQIKAFADALQKEKRRAVAVEGLQQLLLARARIAASTRDMEGVKKVVADLKDAAQAGATPGHIALAAALGNYFDQTGESKAAEDLYRTFSELAAKSADPAVVEQGLSLAGVLRRMTLVGNAMNIEGTTLDGKPLDWSKYKGKVVLVDFWATWCGPCVAEIPNVKEQYEKYHDRGFDVLAISLDHYRQAVERFMDSQGIPWITLYHDGGQHPMAVHYGIMAIPAAILVNQEGKVVTLEARGEALAAELAKLLGPAEEKKQEQPK